MEIISELPVKIKKLYDDAVLPYYATADSAGMDCTAHTVSYNDAKKYWDYKLGFAIEIPTGYVGLLFPRSSVYKTGFSMCNCVGVIDSDYRGEVSAKFYAITNIFSDTVYKVNERCCQLNYT